MAEQERSMELFEMIKDEMPMAYEYAQKHLDVIKQYERFPHRNNVLGRENTQEEDIYLFDPNSGF